MYVYDMRTDADVPVVRINADELQPGDFVGTLHGVAVWEVRNANHYAGWCSVSGTLVTSQNPDNIGNVHTVTANYSGGLARCLRPLANL